MRYKTVETEGYKPYYRVYSKASAEVVAEFHRLYEAIHFVEDNTIHKRYEIPVHSYTLKYEPPITVRNYSRTFIGSDRLKYELVAYPAPEWVIMNCLGDIIPKDVIQTEKGLNSRRRGYRCFFDDYYAERAKKDRRLIYKKGSGDKIKVAYRKVKNNFGSYSNEISSYYRRPKTYSEMRKACGHMDEYGKMMVRAKRNYKNLPDTWDECASDNYDTEKSWKHHSKRRKQWKPK